ncbi:MAG TPA: hypothetical protein VMZ26_00540 [Pyrinomonadaceae bacterium]|nr:hypothetical protein [Pyrinomonadaceae bacterium]
MIELHLKCNEQKSDCISFQLRTTNCGGERLLLPQPEITGLTFIDSKTGKEAGWFTSVLVSSTWAGKVLAPKEHFDVTFQVRPRSVPQPKADALGQGGDYFRFCVELHPSIYAVHYAFTVDEDYFDPDSHWGLPQLEREAAKQSAIPWVGTVKSNILTIQVG